MANNRIRFSNDFVLKDEKVGINTTDPKALLDVGGELKVSGVSTFSSSVNVDGDLQVDGTSTLGFTTASGLYVSGVSTLTVAEVSNLNVSGVSTFTDVDSNQILNSGIATFTNGPILVGSGSSTGTDSQVLQVTGGAYVSGNIGLGTTNTSKKLDVIGDIRSSGTTSANKFITDGGAGSIEIESNAITIPAGELLIDPEPVGFDSGKVRIKGDLYVDGQTISVAGLELGGFKVSIASSIQTDLLLDGAGIGIGSTTIQKLIVWKYLTDSLTSSENFDLLEGKVYKIDGTEVLSSTTLGSGVTNSSLTSVGTLKSINVTGLSTFTGIVTTTTDLYVGGDLYVQDDLVFDSFSANSFVVSGVASASKFVGNLTGNINSTGISTITNLVGTSLSYSGVSTFTNGPILIGSGSSTGTTTQRLQVTGGAYVSDSVGIGTTRATENSKLTIQQAPGSQALDIGTDLTISASGAFNPKVTIGSSVGAGTTEKMEISAVSRDNGLLEIANYGGNQLFSVSNNQSESAFSIYRYANYDNLSITSFENRNLFSVSPLGIVTTYGELRVGTSNTIADSYVYNELYGRLNVRAPFSTATEYVSIVPKFSDKGALSFEAPVGTALTDRGTQIFSISNNVDSSIFRVNDLNRQPIFEASASGNAGIGTTNPQAPFDVAANAQFRNRVGFSQTANPNNTSVIDIQSYTPGITTYFNNSAVVITNNRSNNGTNRAQIYTVEDNDNTLFRVNVLGFGLTTASTPTTPIYQALDIDSAGDIKIFDTSTRKQIVGFATTNPIAGDGDMFRVDAFSSPFIGSFPTVSKAVRIDKFGLVEINRNINQISGITTVGLGSTSSPSINSTMSFELTNNTTLTVRVKGTDGVVRTGIITLS